MNVEVTNENGTITLKPDGWLDANSSPALGTEIEKIESASKIILDFDLVEYIASSGVRQIVAAHKKATACSAELLLVNVRKDVMNILSLTGIDKKLNITQK